MDLQYCFGASLEHCDVRSCWSELAGNPQPDRTTADYQGIEFVAQDLVLDLSAFRGDGASSPFVLPEFGGALAAEEDSKVSGKFMDVLN